MAHGSYDCCAVCDNKQAFNEWGEDAKSVICPSCLLGLHEARRLVEPDAEMVTTPADLIQWMKDAPVVSRLSMYANGYHKCFYGNPVDEEFERHPLTIGEAQR